MEQDKNESNNKIKKLENEIKEIKEKLFPIKEEKDNEEKFDIFKGTKILNDKDEEIMISNWIKPNSKIKFTLLYQISRDGDNISTFYNKVINKFPTLILIKSKAGLKFGGYTTNTWEPTSDYKRDEYSFLFSLSNKKKYSIKNDHIEYAIYGRNDCFAFGDGFDLCIYNQCKLNKNTIYKSSSYNTFLHELSGGQKNFYVDELEVYNVEFE